MVFRSCTTILALSALLCGCAHGTGSIARKKSTEELLNPLLVRANNDTDCWERTVDILHNYFDIAQENRLDGVIETRPKVGAGLLEPWHRDSTGFKNRLESSLQSIRRRAFVSVTATANGYLIGVEVFKEIEDLPAGNGNSAGNATFQENRPLQRNLDTIVGKSAAEGWLTMGRDSRLEERILSDLSKEFSP